MSDIRSTRRDVLFGATAATLATLASVPALPADHSVPTRKALGDRADLIGRALFAETRVPALSVAVARSDGLTWSGSHGLADIELNVPASARQRFKLGSVGKVITATAAARMQSRGILDLDAPIARWLPDLPAAHRETTLRQLLTHRSGIRHYAARDYAADRPGGTIDQQRYPSNKEVLALFINDPLIGPVGGQVTYSTFAYTLASIVMETAAGMAFPELIKAEIGNHFGLASLEEDDPMAIKPGRVRGYTPRRRYESQNPRLKDEWANAPSNNVAYKWAGGGMLMSPADLALFGAALLDAPGSRISAAERTLLFTPMTAATKDSPPLGLGWRIDSDARQRLRWHHAGAQEGCRASLVIYPTLGLSISLATNGFGTPNDVLKPSSDLADAFS